MLKKIILTLFLSSLLPVYAGIYEDALNSGKNMFLYLYTPTCGSCKHFNPVYYKLASENKNNCFFLKINANTEYGYKIFKSFNGRYVPDVILIKGDTKEASRMQSSCLHDFSCADDTIKNYFK